MAKNLVLNGNKLVIQHGGKEFTMDVAGKVLDSSGAAVKADEAKAVAKTVITHLENDMGKLPADVRQALTKNISKFIGFGADKATVEALEKNLKSAEAVRAAAAKVIADPVLHKDEINTIAKELIKNPEAENYLGKEGLTALREAKFSWPKLESFKAAKDTLVELSKGDKVSKDAIKKHLINNFEHIEHLQGSEALLNRLDRKGMGFDWAELTTEVKDGVTKAQGELKTVLGDITAKAGEIKRMEKAPGIKPEVLTKAKTALGELEKKYTEIAKGEFGDAALKEVHATDKTLVEEAKKASSSLSSSIESSLKSIESGASKVAKDGVSFIKKLYTHTAAGEKFGKVHNGKVAGLVAVGAVTAYVLAAPGKKGKAADINAEQVQAQLAAQQGQQPEMAGAAR